jgi:RNA polymerase sigma factor (sigma-70 family)
MASPLPQRKPATELEIRLSTGVSVEPRDVIAIIDQPMHDELVRAFTSALSADERDDLSSDVIVELMEKPTRYDVSRASLPHYAKLRVWTLAVSYLKKRTKTRKQERNFKDHGYLVLASPMPPGPMECDEYAAAYAAAVQSVSLEIMKLPLAQQRAVRAYQEYGPERYAARLAEELGVTPNLVSQWWTRAKKRLRKVAEVDLVIFE